MTVTDRITTTHRPMERRRRAWARRLSLVLVAPSMLALASASPTKAALPPECVLAANGIDAVCTYIGPAGQQWSVLAPSGATSMRIRAVGQAGQTSSDGVPGGAGRWVEQTLSTTPGTPFVVSMVNDGGLGPGGAGDGGGSATVHRAGTLLVQAAGGGGAGDSANGNTPGGQGGNAHVAGANGGGGSSAAEGGRPGTSSAHGLGGAGGCFPFIGCAAPGGSGSTTRGGAGGNDSSGGGGGGGGLAKGGGGGSGFFDAGVSGAGGGGGFSFPTNALSGLASPAETRRVVITFFRARATFSATQVAFGNVLVGTTSSQQPLVVRNTGTAPLTISSVTLSQSQAAFQKNAGCVGATLAPNATCIIGLTFSPPSMGTFQATLTVGSDTMEGGDSVVTLQGTGVQPVATLTPTSVTFPDTLVGVQSPSQSVTMRNTGTASLFIASVDLIGPDATSFIKGVGCAGQNLAPNATCTVILAFRPTSEGPKTAELSFTDNAPGSPHKATLTGTGTLPQVSLTPSEIDFGDVGVGTSSGEQLATIENIGTGPLQVFAVTVEGADVDDFVIGDHACVGTIPAGSSCSIPVRFDPQRRGTRTAVLQVTDSAAGSPHQVTPVGNGVALGDLQVRGPGSVFTRGQGSLVTLAVAPAGTASYGVKVINTTAAPRSFEIALTQDGAAATATLHNGFAQLPKNAAGNYVSGVLQPGKSIIYTLKVKPTAPGQVTSGVDVHLVAANGAEHDFVTTETNVRAPAKGTDSFGVFARAGSQQYVGGSVDGQTTTANSVAMGASTTYNAMLRNDGAAATAMTFRMSAAANPCWTTKVTVKQGLATVDITAEATGSGYLTKVLPVNGSLIVTITLKRVASSCGALSWQVASYDGPTLKHFSYLLANPAV